MQLLKRMRYLFEPRAIILMYHRIAEVSPDPWQLAVSPQNFEQQLQVLQKSGKLIPAKELLTSLHQKSITGNSISITFDDGYSDNYLVAKPLLEKYKCSASFFIATQYTGLQRQFWWDELEGIILSYPILPETLALSINGSLFEFHLGNDGMLSNDQLLQHRKWVWPGAPPTRRCELYLAIWEQLKPLPYNELQSTLTEIKCWASFKQSSETEGFPMTQEQLKDLTNHPFIDIGMHTLTHPALSHHSLKVQHAEISGSRQYLENITQLPVDALAYPYGDYNDLTLSVVKELHLNAAFTTAEKVVVNRTDPYQIGRFQVKNWSGEELERWIIKWKKSAQFL